MPPETVARPRPLADAVADYRRSPTPLGLHDLLRPFVAACYEIASAHNRGTAHLSLTPQIILLGDFGITTLDGWDRTAPGANGEPGDAYSAAFLAPEQVAGSPEKVGPASDVYSLGAILYFVLAGQPPFLGDTAAEVLTRLREGLPWQPRMVAAGVPAALEGVCLTAMERDPAERYPSAAEVAREVERWMAGQRVSTNYAEPKTVRLARFLRSRSGLLTLIGLLLASLFALTVAISVIHRERQYTREDAQKLAETIKEKVAEINRQRALTSEEFGAATRALRDLALEAQRQPNGEATPPRFKADVLRKVHEGAQRMASYADLAAGTDLAAAHDRISLGELFLALGRPDEASRQYERAVIITRAVAAQQPDSLQAKNGLYLSAVGLATVQLSLHNPANARQIARTALAAAEERAAADPGNTALRRDVARCHDLIVDASISLHDLSAARAAATDLVTTVESYANADPKNLSGRFDLANAFIARGKVERLDHVFEAALPWYDRALAILRPLKASGKLAPFPQEVTRLDDLEKVAQECRDIVKTVEDVNFALKERGGETQRRLLLGRAVALARRGRVADAAATALIVRGLKPEDGSNLYDVACCYALCVPTARAEYVARALGELRAAADHGFRDVETIESDPDFDALRAEPGYRAFVAELKARRLWLTLPVLP
jgi:tetratricopeptide (TPR) repeat protein